MISPMQLLVAGGGVLIFGGIGLIWFLNRKSFKNKVWVARQTGKAKEDVIWFEDKCRVVNKSGAWIIEFEKIKEKTRSIDGKFWTSLITPKYQQKALKFSKDEWDQLNMRTNLMRGLFLYETTEGEFYPMAVEHKDGRFAFQILDQDNRQFMIEEIKDVNDLTRNHKTEITLLWGIIIGIVVLALVFFGGMWWQGHEHAANLAATAQVCASYTREMINISASNAGYIGQLGNVLGG